MELVLLVFAFLFVLINFGLFVLIVLNDRKIKALRQKLISRGLDPDKP